MNNNIILATTSKPRINAFKSLGIKFTHEDSKIDEKNLKRPKEPNKLVKYLATLKAQSVSKNHMEGLVIGADSIGLFKGKILEKPASKREAFKRLKELSGKTCYLYTGVCIINIKDKKKVTKFLKTQINMRRISEKEINMYLHKYKSYSNYALGFSTIDTLSTTFIREIKGSYHNTISGLPLELIIQML
jgi:septum formation protein